MTRTEYNPDVLSCIANLSNDEVFTPPQIANQMLDLLPAELWSNPKAKFLDPFAKSGVFLREIAKRLIAGLETQMPDLQQRINHIMANQIYGIGITELTSLLARRSLYCTKDADGEYSVADVFESPQGNIAYENIPHTWDASGKCTYCGVSRDVMGEGQREGLESHAYMFIHDKNPFENMQFDVIIGNPPYQMNDGSGAAGDAAMPIYNKFVLQAKKLNPKFLIMIIPSKWMVGGRGLNNFREEMMTDRRIKYLFDYENSADCFSGVHLDGGACYFLWDSNYNGLTNYNYKTKEGEILTSNMILKNDYFDYVIRDQRIISILEKTSKDNSFSEIVSATMPFGIRKYLFNDPSRYPDSNLKFEPFENSVKIFGVKGIKGGAKRVIGYISPKIINRGKELVERYKLFFTTSYSTNAINPPEAIIADKNEICTETFLVIGPFKDKKEQINCYNYLKTNLFKTLLFYGKGTMQVTRSVFGLVPLQDFSKSWTDEELYKKYGLTQDEIDYIEKMVRPME